NRDLQASAVRSTASAVYRSGETEAWTDHRASHGSRRCAVLQVGREPAVSRCPLRTCGTFSDAAPVLPLFGRHWASSRQAFQSVGGIELGTTCRVHETA